MESTDIIQSVLKGIMGKGSNSKLKKRAMKGKKDDDDEKDEHSPTVVKISVMEPMGVMSMDKDKPMSEVMERLKKKVKK